RSTPPPHPQPTGDKEPFHAGAVASATSEPCRRWSWRTPQGRRRGLETMASPRSSFSRMVEESLDGRDKITHLEWLALKGVEPGVRNLLPVRSHHRRGHRHDGNLSSRLLGSQLS